MCVAGLASSCAESIRSDLLPIPFIRRCRTYRGGMPTDDGSPPGAPDQFLEPDVIEPDADAVESTFEGPVTFSPVAAGAPQDTGYDARGVPTFEMVRERIETRFGTSLGAVELGSETPEGRRVEEQFEARQKAAAEKLDEIRRSMKAAGDT